MDRRAEAEKFCSNIEVGERTGAGVAFREVEEAETAEEGAALKKGRLKGGIAAAKREEREEESKDGERRSEASEGTVLAVMLPFEAVRGLEDAADEVPPPLEEIEEAERAAAAARGREIEGPTRDRAGGE